MVGQVNLGEPLRKVKFDPRKLKNNLFRLFESEKTLDARVIGHAMVKAGYTVEEGNIANAATSYLKDKMAGRPISYKKLFGQGQITFTPLDSEGRYYRVSLK